MVHQSKILLCTVSLILFMMLVLMIIIITIIEVGACSSSDQDVKTCKMVENVCVVVQMHTPDGVLLSWPTSTHLMAYYCNGKHAHI